MVPLEDSSHHLLGEYVGKTPLSSHGAERAPTQREVQQRAGGVPERLETEQRAAHEIFKKGERRLWRRLGHHGSLEDRPPVGQGGMLLRLCAVRHHGSRPATTRAVPTAHKNSQRITDLMN